MNTSNHELLLPAAVWTGLLLIAVMVTGCQSDAPDVLLPSPADPSAESAPTQQKQDAPQQTSVATVVDGTSLDQTASGTPVQRGDEAGGTPLPPGRIVFKILSNESYANIAAAVRFTDDNFQTVYGLEDANSTSTRFLGTLTADLTWNGATVDTISIADLDIQTDGSVGMGFAFPPSPPTYVGSDLLIVGLSAGVAPGSPCASVTVDPNGWFVFPEDHNTWQGYGEATYDITVDIPGLLSEHYTGSQSLDHPFQEAMSGRVEVDDRGVPTLTFPMDVTFSDYYRLTTLGIDLTSASIHFLVGQAHLIGQVVAVPANRLLLAVPEASLYVRPGETVVTNLDVADLLTRVNGCQAMLGYQSTYLQASPGCVDPGGGAWDQLVYNSWDVGAGVPDEIDTAIGVHAQGSVGTDADGTVAVIALQALTEGATRMVFRPDDEPDPGLVGATMLSDMNHQPVWPSLFDSRQIIIDGTLPTVTTISATQDGDELLVENGSSEHAVVGTVEIVVHAADVLSGGVMSGLAGVPSVTVTPQSGSSQVAIFVEENPAGVFTYSWDIVVGTPNGLASINASVADRAGNTANALERHFVINTNRIDGTVATKTLKASLVYSFTRDVVFKATDAGGSVLKTWIHSVEFANDPNTQIASGAYTLTDVPSGIAGLSAKTAWTLREKVAATLDGTGHATVDFVASDMLRGGDLNGSNSVTTLDYSVLTAAFGTLDTVADVNGDEGVTSLDYSLLTENWYQVGDSD